METKTVTQEAELQALLRGNAAYANGKNVAVEYLYATAAQSRFAFENVYGIYLTRPSHAWMAAWIAVTDREKLRKRHLCYCAPSAGDAVGSLALGGVGEGDPRRWLRDEAYLYLFDIEAAKLDLSALSEDALLQQLLERNYRWQDIERRGQFRRTLMPPKDIKPTLIELDEWQAVLVGAPRLIPTKQLVLSGELINSLAARITFEREMPGRDYLRNKLLRFF